MAFLNEFTTGELADKPLEELLDVILASTNDRFSEPEKFAEKIRKAARNSCPLNPKMQNSVDVALAMTCENIRFSEDSARNSTVLSRKS